MATFNGDRVENIVDLPSGRDGWKYNQNQFYGLSEEPKVEDKTDTGVSGPALWKEWVQARTDKEPPVGSGYNGRSVVEGNKNVTNPHQHVPLRLRAA